MPLAARLRQALYVILLLGLLALPESPRTWAASFGESFPETGTPLLVYSVLQEGMSELRAAPATDPARSSTLARVQHQAGFGLRARVSPQGDRLAYLVLPVGSRDPSREGELWLLNLSSGEQRRLTGGVDVQGMPVWSPEGAAVAVRQRAGEGFALRAVDTRNGKITPLVAVTEALTVQAIGWATEAADFYYAVYTQQGTDVYRYAPAAGTGRLALHASNLVARDFKLDGAGKRLLYTELLPPGGPPTRTVVAELSGAELRVLEAASGGFSPTWSSDTKSITLGTAGGLLPQTSGHSLRLQSVQEATGVSVPGGLVAPLAWSPGGDYLAARLLTGDGPDRVTSEQLVVLQPGDSKPIAVTGDGHTTFAGWAR